MKLVDWQLADECLAQDKYDEAIALYEECISVAHHEISNYCKLGVALLLKGEELAAQAVWLQLIFQGNAEQVEAKTGELIKVLEAEAVQRFQASKYQQAETIYLQLLEYEPNNSEAYKNLGYVMVEQGKVEEAIAHYQQALTLDPKLVVAHHNLGFIFHEQGKIENASAHYQQALTLDPNYTIAHNSLGTVFLEKQEFEKAMVCFNRALELDPDFGPAHYNRAMILLQCGDYERGFAEYEWRWVTHKNPPCYSPQPLWSGEELEGRTILLHQVEQGFGDTIQFIRYAKSVQERGGHVVVQCYQPLVRLLKTVAGINKVVAQETDLPEFDVQAPLLSLPYILGTTLETIPAQIPYINHDPLLRLKLESSSVMKVGLVWAGNPENQNDRNRSCTLKQFSLFLNTPGITFYSLQKEPGMVELNQLSEKLLLQDLSGCLGDFADTAAVIAQMDLVITVDTAVAHLTGALGLPVWVLLSFNADWRWLLGREDSPWYPTMRLFRQQQPGEWAEVLSRVLEALLLFRDYNNKG